jgi:hypothetical protein
MSLFGKLVRTTINVAVGLPVAVVKDAVTLGGVSTEQRKPYTAQALDRVKEEADD